MKKYWAYQQNILLSASTEFTNPSNFYLFLKHPGTGDVFPFHFSSPDIDFPASVIALDSAHAVLKRIPEPFPGLCEAG